MYKVRTTSSTYPTIVTERYECCIAIFNKGRRFIVAITEPVARNGQGGVIAQRVVRTLEAEERGDETMMRCTLLWIDPAISFVDEQTKMVRSIVYSDGEFGTIIWQDADGLGCEYGD